MAVSFLPLWLSAFFRHGCRLFAAAAASAPKRLRIPVLRRLQATAALPQCTSLKNIW
jgi:hypothetical protein